MKRVFVEQACKRLAMQFSRLQCPILCSIRTPKDVVVAATFVTYHSPSWAVRVCKRVKRAYPKDQLAGAPWRAAEVLMF